MRRWRRRLARPTARPAAVGAAALARPRPAELALSYAQRRLWFLDRLEGAAAGQAAASRAAYAIGAASYVIPLAVRLTGGLDRAALMAR